jgi:glycosyltransferase involved in cell wall biosynthesis
VILNTPPRLTVITPVFNGIRFIESCIQNVIGQECAEVEHIIVDGGSTDGTLEVIERYGASHRHLRWLSEQDQGQSDAMNKGIALARGEILGFLNVDDYYEPHVLRRVVEAFRGLPDLTFLVGNCNVWDNDGKLWFVSAPYRISFENLLSGRFMEALPMNPSAYFYHASLHGRIGPYDREEHYAMDVDFVIRAVRAAHVVYLDEMLGNFRYLEGTKTFTKDSSGETQQIVRKVVYRHLQELPLFLRLKLMVRYEWPRNRFVLKARSVGRRLKAVAAGMAAAN